MQIIVTPSDIINRCLWDKFRKFCLHQRNEDDVKKIIEENKPLSLSEEDAFAIGLLKVIETDNFIHRFNEHMMEVLQIKSNVFKDELFINKQSITKELSSYMDKFPEYYKPTFHYKKSIDDLKNYISVIEENVSKAEVFNVKNKEKIMTYYKSKDIKKCLEI
jgi:translation initiation factor 2B subunit (eIF-2B alpha/beta/delta family)